MKIEVVGHRIGIGCDASSARRNQFRCAEQCFEFIVGTKFPGEIWMAPVTTRGESGRWILVAVYSGDGVVRLVSGEEVVCPDQLVGAMKRRVQNFF